MKFLIIFIILSIVNVIFSTIRSITTIKGGKTVASLWSGGYFAFYNIMLIYTVADFPMWQKCLITFCCNVAGVWIVKLIEEKMQKDKLWKIELTINKDDQTRLENELTAAGISFNTQVINKWAVFNCYCPTRKESHIVRETAKTYGAKVFANEAKII